MARMSHERILVAVAAALLTACGGGEAEVSVAPAPTADRPPAEQPPAPGHGEPGSPPAQDEGSAPCDGPPPGPGYECVQDCGPPVASDSDPEPGWSWLSEEQARRREQFGCPICLPADAPIATPAGAVPISALSPGATVWSVDETGRRVESRVVHVRSVPAPAGHELVVVELADGRTVRASPGHPDALGRPLGALSPGDELDGSNVVRVHRVPYRGRTYDLVLDDGHTTYVAAGVTLRSTLSQ